MVNCSKRYIAAAAKFTKRDFKKADNIPQIYNQQQFTLDGCMDLDVSFDDMTMKTPA